MALLKLRPLSCLALLLAVGGLLLPAGCGRTEGRAGAEVRGVWLHPTWGTEPTTALPAVRRQVRDLASLGFNMIFPLVENHLAYYPSSAAAPTRAGTAWTTRRRWSTSPGGRGWRRTSGPASIT